MSSHIFFFHMKIMLNGRDMNGRDMNGRDVICEKIVVGCEFSRMPRKHLSFIK